MSGDGPFFSAGRASSIVPRVPGERPLEFDLQRFYRINRRFLMWGLFFFFLYLLRGYFTLIFLTFVLGFAGRQVANTIVRHVRVSYRLAVIIPYVLFVAIMSVFLSLALPRLLREGREFAQNESLQEDLLAEMAKLKADYPFIERLIEEKIAVLDAGRADPNSWSTESRPAGLTRAERERRDKEAIRALAEEYVGPFPKLVLGFLGTVVIVTLQFVLAIFLSFLILLDYTRIRNEVVHWRDSAVGAFFEETAISVVNFATVVGRAFQCQFYVTTLNAVLTLVGLLVLDIQPVVLLTAIVFMFGFIPVIGVFISSVPIILIALNSGGLPKGLYALSVIVMVHLAEAYIFNPRIYAARFHLNPVITLIILLIAHRLFGVWGMLLGIPVTHYALTVAIQMPRPDRPRAAS